MSTRVLMAGVVSLAIPLRTVAADKDLIPLQTAVHALRDKLAQVQSSLDENIGLMSDGLKRSAENIRNLEQRLDALRSQTHPAALPDEQVQRLVSGNLGLKTAVAEFRNRADSFETKPKGAQAMAPAAPVPPQSTTAAPAPPSPPPAAAMVVTPPSQPSPAPAPAEKLVAPAAVTTSVAPSAPPKPAPEPSRPATTGLYESAMEHYAAKDYELAANEFTKYLNSQNQPANAVNAHFYLGEIEYQQNDFEGALQDYTAVTNRLEDTAKAASAQYKKALCLLQVERRDDAVEELQVVIQQYPKSAEAGKAAKKLRELGASKKTP